MSKFRATISEIVHSGDLHIVTLRDEDIILKMISLELSEKIQVGVSVMLCVKATTVAIAKNFSGELSYSNQIELEIKEFEQGELLSSLELQKENFMLESIITTAGLKRMNLTKGERVTALIKSSDLSIVEIL